MVQFLKVGSKATVQTKVCVSLCKWMDFPCYDRRQSQAKAQNRSLQSSRAVTLEKDKPPPSEKEFRQKLFLGWEVLYSSLGQVPVFSPPARRTFHGVRFIFWFRFLF